ncbi:PKD domain-containing protein [Intrasporangium calvum]|uniref:PKD domain-containing protein n=1 Tax=Intrasporangium calvum TaxID=53358 RepID=UPI0019022056|nr:PKD domain-containing protein [Intrasporangium calvum]
MKSSIRAALRPRRQPAALLAGLALAATSAVAVPTAASAASSVTVISNPDAYVCSETGYIGFEDLTDLTNLSAGAIGGVQFTTTAGYSWLVGDFATGGYNGKYPSGQYTSHGTHWAWLGVDQGAGRIDFVNGPASTFSLLASTNTPVVLEAYDSSAALLESTASSGTNLGTGTMAELKITRASADIAYVVVHDTGNYFEVDDICTDAPGVNPPSNTAPDVAVDAAVVAVDEASAAGNTGTFSDADEDAISLSASVGTVSESGPGTWAWSHTPSDGPVDSQTVTITADDGTDTSTATFDLQVSNVAPTITSLTPSATTVVTGQPVTFVGQATDPSGPDTAAGFSWSFDGGAYGTSNEFTTAYATCGSNDVTALAKDKDNGVSAPFTSSAVMALDSEFLPPLQSGTFNKVRGGQVVPVKISVGCDGMLASGLSPAIQLLSGDVDPSTDPGDGSVDVVTETVSSADTSGVMRAADGQYIYNLRIPAGASGAKYTIRVRPTGTAVGGARYIAIQLR